MDITSIQEHNSAARIRKLRSEMILRGLNALIIPRFDAHQGEYIAPHDERLRWISGFSGSAGMGIVMIDRAALFVDGRYTVQAMSETDEQVFEQQHIFNKPPEKWLETHLNAGMTVGYDPMLLPPSWAVRFKRASETNQANWIAIDDNPVDRIWEDQPSPPCGEIFPMTVSQSGRSTDDKVNEVARLLQNENVDYLVETQPDNIAWLLNIRGRDAAYNPMPHSFLILDRHGNTEWFVDPRKLPQDRSDFDLSETDIAGPEQFLGRLADKLQSGDKVWADPDFSPSACQLIAEEKGAQVKLARNPVTELKAIKNETELTGMRDCHIKDGLAWCEFLAELDERVKQGQTVSELEAEEIIQGYRENGPDYLYPSFRTISATDAHGAMCHYAATEASNALISENSIYLVDSGGQYLSGTTDATRTMCFKPAPGHICKAYTLVLKGFIALSSLKFPKGTQGHHIDAIARQHLWAHGLDYDHGTGHGVGHCLSVHEHPQRIGKPYNPVDLHPGMVVTIEPGFYEAGEFGIRTENQVEIVELEDGFMGFSPLTMIPIQQDMIQLDLMSEQEISWLNGYHDQVEERLLNDLSPRAQAWLKDTITPNSL